MEITFTLDEKSLDAVRKMIREENESFFQNFREKLEKKPRYFTREEAAKLLRVTTQTLWLWDRDGILKARKIGTKVLYPEYLINQYQEINNPTRAPDLR
jgi:excisionase family DNA binding protein